MSARVSGVVQRIVAFNRGRERERLALKYAALQTSAFRFLRGTCHLFHEDWPARSGLNGAPRTWISGDLHLENFGAYKGDDRIIYFDINDFDEAVLAPCTREVTRFATSVLVAARDYQLGRPEAVLLCREYLDAYADALGRGKARRVEGQVADGMVSELLDALGERSRRELLDRRTERLGGRRVLRLGKHALPVTREQERLVGDLLKRIGRTHSNPSFFRMLDVARRVAGTGSLGLQRFVILVEGKGSPDSNYLLDLKQTRPSAAAAHLASRQPKWKTEAERVVGIQDRMQAAAPALLRPVMLDGMSCVLRELQPSEDRLSLDQWGGKIGRLEGVMRTMGSATAWGQLRSAGRQGSAIADELIAFAGLRDWRREVLKVATASAKQVVADWQVFRKANVEELLPA